MAAKQDTSAGKSKSKAPKGPPPVPRPSASLVLLSYAPDASNTTAAAEAAGGEEIDGLTGPEGNLGAGAGAKTGAGRSSSSSSTGSDAGDSRAYDYKVVMVRRNDKSSFKNATVFPGGNLDACDGAVRWPDLLAARNCALRECFEETGILVTAGLDANLARSTHGSGTAASASASDAGTSASVQDELQKQAKAFPKGTGERRRWREAVHGDASKFEAMLSEKRLSTAPMDLVHFHNWVTPVQLPRRYDTHFFIAAVPEALTKDARHDASETLALAHYTPTQAIAAHARGEILLMVPQLYMLHDLAAWHSWRDVVRNARRSGGERGTAAGTLGEGRGWCPVLKPKLGCSILPGDEDSNVDGGNVGARNRSEVEFNPDGLRPKRLLRKGIPGLEDIDTAINGPDPEAKSRAKGKL